MKTIVFASTLLLIDASIAAAGESGPKGIAFVQAPEQSSGMCLGDNAKEAFACAVQQCVDGGALAEDCIETNWCDPAGWSVDFFVQHEEGPHWHEIICGLDSKETAKALEPVICDRTRRNHLIECAAVRLISPQGKEQNIED